MAPYNFDDRNIKWNELTLPPVGELKHVMFSILLNSFLVTDFSALATARAAWS
jgi:hypothetical protein